MPDRLGDARSVRFPLYEASFGQFLLKIEGVARYLVCDGERICVDIAPGADLDAVSVLLDTSVFAALLYQRGILPLHASAIATARGGVILAGPSGCGKSTLAGAFHQRGFTVIADELCAIDLTGSDMSRVPELLPANPAILLWADALDRLGLERSMLRREQSSVEKFILPLRHGFASEPVPVCAIYVLDVATSGGPAIVPVTGVEKIRLLAGNVYRGQIVKGMSLSTRLFRQIHHIARHIPVARVVRPAGEFGVGELIHLLEGDFAA